MNTENNNPIDRLDCIHEYLDEGPESVLKLMYALIVSGYFKKGKIEDVRGALVSLLWFSYGQVDKALALLREDLNPDYYSGIETVQAFLKTAAMELGEIPGSAERHLNAAAGKVLEIHIAMLMEAKDAMEEAYKEKAYEAFKA
ncbi:MAG: hypothetical protein M0Z48_06430 [Nitrospiraceae bacterium]|nr:hypothetical protein [Nitrospiraceae bacterium]